MQRLDRSEKKQRSDVDRGKLVQAFDTAIYDAIERKTTGEVVCRVKLTCGGLSQSSLQVIEEVPTF